MELLLHFSPKSHGTSLTIFERKGVKCALGLNHKGGQWGRFVSKVFHRHFERRAWRSERARTSKVEREWGSRITKCLALGGTLKLAFATRLESEVEKALDILWLWGYEEWDSGNNRGKLIVPD
ncbi:hypothetical protein CsSME_00031206 [Camellia sinensis var. sinensis]